MRYLVVSDIHGNLEGLGAVLDAAAGRYQQIVCCGDLVGYGADPNAVVYWARASLAAVVRGNHDRACCGLIDPDWFNPSARAAALWTGQQLTPENLAWLRALPRGAVPIEDGQLLHGSPIDEDEYLMRPEEAASAFHYTTAAVSFIGHTHWQGGFVWRGETPERLAGTGPRSDRRVLEIDDHAVYLLNPGSAGQPRDGDPRAGYALYDTEARMLSYERVAYDVNTAQEKIRRAGLPDVLAARLALGR